MTELRDLVVVGGGEHARVVMEAARTQADKWRLVGFVDPAPHPETERAMGVPCLGGDEEAFALARSRATVAFVLGIAGVGVSGVRSGLVARYDVHAVSWAAVIHERAWVAPTARLGAGVFVGCGAVVNANAVIGEHAILNTGAIVEHDVVLEAFVQAGPASAVGGGARVGASSYLGLGCRVRDHVQIGRGVLVGMGAVVLESVADGSTVWGVPARAPSGPGRA